MTHIELKQIRESLNIETKKLMAEVLHISRVCYLRYENGERKIPSYTAREVELFLLLPEWIQEDQITLYRDITPRGNEVRVITQ